MARLKPYLGDLVVVLLIVVLATKVTADIQSVRDLEFADETNFYLIPGCLIPHLGFPDAAFSPVYALWYCFLFFLKHDPAAIYYVNWCAIHSIVPLSLYLFIRSLGGPRVIGLLAAAFTMNSNFGDLPPYPSHFAASVLLLATACAVRMRSSTWAFTLLAIGLLLASYIRPEFFVTFVLLCVAGLATVCVLLIKNHYWNLNWVYSTILIAISVVSLTDVLGSPLSSTRSIIAFGQHYALNRRVAKDIDLHPWFEYEKVLQRDFGDVHTIGQALRSNPSAASWHILANLKQFPRSLVRVILPKPHQRLHAGDYGFVKVISILGGLLGIVGVAGHIHRLRHPELSDCHNRNLRLSLFVFALLVVTLLLSGLLIYPRPHYLVPVVIFFVGLVSAGASFIPSQNHKYSKLDSLPALAVLGLVLILLVPNRAHGWNIAALLKSWTTTNRELLSEQAINATLRNLNLTRPIVALDATVNRASMVRITSRSVSPLIKTSRGFWEFVERRNINLVFLTKSLQGFPRFRLDPQFQDFYSERELRNFSIIEVPGSNGRIAVRNDLLPRGGKHVGP